jgi:hypothetical protein
MSYKHNSHNTDFVNSVRLPVFKIEKGNNVSETGCVSTIKREKVNIYSVGPLRNSKHQSLYNPCHITLSRREVRRNDAVKIVIKHSHAICEPRFCIDVNASTSHKRMGRRDL